MTNPWLNIPLQDYEGHMALPNVGQAEMLANQLAGLLAQHESTSVALIGCAGGNGFFEVAEAHVTRLVGIDINPQYVADAQARFAHSLRNGLSTTHSEMVPTDTNSVVQGLDSLSRKQTRPQYFLTFIMNAALQGA